MNAPRFGGCLLCVLGAALMAALPAQRGLVSTDQGSLPPPAGSFDRTSHTLDVPPTFRSASKPVSADSNPRRLESRRYGFMAAAVSTDADRLYDDFRGRLAADWTWLREDRTAWRVSDRGLEVRIQPGNMWGAANNARNILVRPAPDPAQQEVSISVAIENRPTEQYEQVNLVWYYTDGYMVKLGQELVDGKLSIVMGREENDRTRTIAIIPIDSFTIEVRLVVRGSQIRGEFRTTAAEEWRVAGRCDAPVNGVPKISLQCYQGPAQVERWARLSDFSIRTRVLEAKRPPSAPPK